MHSDPMTHTTVDIPDSPSIACSLTVAGYRQRVADTGQVARDALRERRAIGGGARLTFEDTADVRRRLEAFIAAESACCRSSRCAWRATTAGSCSTSRDPSSRRPSWEELFA